MAVMGLHIDAGRLAAVKLNREDRVCQVRHSPERIDSTVSSERVKFATH